ncbi:MAG TPA: biotin--[acetyl-CoA-carboxylase] ligase, partial [Methanocorpusculum sp.]|nr:biotin--[acetyl-CoA-carboxylase] ligase [Methanocorpusculum sp.]
IAADEQSSGRGRLGKSFHSPKGGIYISIILKSDMISLKKTPITFAAANAVCKAIEEVSDELPSIKWVNDIFVKGKKVCGILTQKVPDSDYGSIIVGIGVNYKTKEFPENLESAGTLFDESSSLSRNEFIALIADKVIEYACHSADNVIMDIYKSHSNVIGKEISFAENGQLKSAYVIGIDDFGGLVIEEDFKVRTISCGEISVKVR